MPQDCPAEGLLKLIAGKWKPQLLRLAIENPLRFNQLLRQLPDANKQSLATALKDLVEADLLVKTIIKKKPLHIEYTLSDKGHSMTPIFKQLEGFQ